VRERTKGVDHVGRLHGIGRYYDYSRTVNPEGAKLTSGGNFGEDWRSDSSRNMVRPVRQSLLRTLIYVLVLAQVSLSPPVVAAIAFESASTSEMPCADSMPATSDGKACPCCPDDIRGVSACLSACAGAAATISTVVLARAVATSMATPAAPRVRLIALADPPLKPPPIP
jgi:hypothetical protein